MTEGPPDEHERPVEEPPASDGKTGRGRRTRERILEQAAGLIRTQGFGGTSVGDILAATRVPKGCFYHHFESKEALGHEILGRWVDELEGRLLDYLTRGDGPPPLERIAAALDGFLTEQEQSGCRGGSAFGNLATELSDASETFRATLSAAFRRLSDAFAMLLMKARARGELVAEAEPAALADFLVAAIEGGILLGRVHRDPSVLASVLRTAEAHLWSLRKA
jgi:TetR/AcrR family transcriptional repressor of nem operon